MARPHLFVPCIVDQFYPETGISAVKILRMVGRDPIYNPEQTCCGQTAFNAGYHDDAISVAERFIEVFRDAEEIVALSGSCAAMVSVLYPQIGFPQSLKAEIDQIAARTYEFTYYLVRRIGVTDLGGVFDGKVAYHDSCHILRELRISEEPRMLLRGVQGLDLVELEATDRCCGFGGMFAVKFPDVSVAMGEDRLGMIGRADADIVVGCDNSCLMHLQGLAETRNIGLKTMHIAEFLARCIPGNGGKAL